MNSLSSATAAAGLGLGFTVFIYIVTIVACLIINFIVAKKFEQIAIDKGHPNVHAFAMCFWLGWIGYIYVVALPDRRRAGVESTPSRRFPKTETSSNGAIIHHCPRCNQVIYRGVDTCPNCNQGIYWEK